MLHVAPLELVRSIYQGRLAPTTFQVRTTLRAGQGRAGGPARRGALQAPTRDRTQGVGDRITKRTLAAHSGEYSGRDGGGRGWARRWRWRGVGGARAGDGQAEPAAWAGRAGRRSRPARDIGGWAGLGTVPHSRGVSPLAPGEPRSLAVQTHQAHTGWPPCTPLPPHPHLADSRGHSRRGCWTTRHTQPWPPRGPGGRSPRPRRGPLPGGRARPRTVSCPGLPADHGDSTRCLDWFL